MIRIRLYATLFAAVSLSAQGRWNSVGFSPDGPIMPGKVAPVTGAPYSAQVVSEIIDINGTTHSAISRLYRDRDGRERCEETSDGSFKAIFISDPVENISYVLDLDRKTARRSTGQEEVAWDIHGAMVRFTPGPVQSTAAAKGITDLGITTSEDLGTRMMEGFEVVGTRVRSGGEINERWFCPELHMTLLMTRGTTTYKLSNIIRADQPRPLFEVPADYKVYSSYGVRMLEISRKQP